MIRISHYQESMFYMIGLFVLSLSYSVPIKAQKAFNDKREGYIVTPDTTYKGGKITSEMRRPERIIYEAVKNNTAIFQAEDVLYYEMRKGVYYEKQRLTYKGKKETAVFLKRIAEGEMSLFHLKDRRNRFFIKQDGEFSELERSSFRTTLADQLNTCNNWQQEKQLRFRKASLRNFFQQLEQKSCRALPLPSVGLSFTSGIMNLTLPANTFFAPRSGIVELQDNTYRVGLFYNQPIWKIHGLFLAAEGYWSPLQLNNSVRSETIDQDIRLTQDAITFRSGLKYSFGKSKWRPYIEAGIGFSRNWNTEILIFEALKTPETIETSYQDTFFEVYPDTFSGGYGAIGITYFYAGRHFLTVGVEAEALRTKTNYRAQFLAITAKANL